MTVPLRPPVPDDAAAVLDVLQARDVADYGIVDFTLEDLLDEWGASDFALAEDAVVAESDEGRIVAYACVRRPGTLAVVDPDHEGQGIGAELLRWAEGRDRALGRPRHRQWVAAGNAAAHALLERAGYRAVRTYVRMARRLDAPVAVVAPPPGVTVRTLDVERDAVAAHELDRMSFAANADYEPEEFEVFRQEHLEAHDLDPGLSRVGEQDGRLAGLLLARRWVSDAVGFVDLLAVHPDGQRRGLATALLTDAFAGFAAAGLREAQLGVASDNPRALALYERVGMAPKLRTDTFERVSLSPG